MFYFAYGSNMNLEQMKERCPRSNFIGKASLKGYKFAYSGYSHTWGGATANIIESKGEIVRGGLFKIDKECLRKLDECEGYNSKAYDRALLEVQHENGRIYEETYVYLRHRTPTDKYRQRVVQGAKDCGLPLSLISLNR